MAALECAQVSRQPHRAETLRSDLAALYLCEKVKWFGVDSGGDEK